MTLKCKIARVTSWAGSSVGGEVGCSAGGEVGSTGGGEVGCSAGGEVGCTAGGEVGWAAGGCVGGAAHIVVPRTTAINITEITSTLNIENPFFPMGLLFISILLVIYWERLNRINNWRTEPLLV
jgi:hypothetical protein